MKKILFILTALIIGSCGRRADESIKSFTHEQIVETLKKYQDQSKNFTFDRDSLGNYVDTSSMAQEGQRMNKRIIDVLKESGGHAVTPAEKRFADIYSFHGVAVDGNPSAGFADNDIMFTYEYWELAMLDTLKKLDINCDSHITRNEWPQ